MKTQHLSREDFLKWLAVRSRQITDQTPPIELKGPEQSISLVWLDTDDEPIISVPDSQIKDFMAFVTTYIGTYTPFTAFFRVIPQIFVEELPRQRRKISDKTFSALLGAVICDAAVQIGFPPPKASDLSVQACLATPSASLISAILLGYDLDLAMVAINRWYGAKADISGLQSGRISADQVMSFWSVVLSALWPEFAAPNTDDMATRLIRSALVGKEGDSQSDYAILSASLPGMSRLLPLLKSNREDRVRALDQLIASIGPGGSRSLQTDMLLGYFAAQVAEGSLSYIPLASRMSEQFPSSVLWYGLFAGLSPYSDVLTAGDCLGRRIWRRLLVGGEGLGPIHADISYEELAFYLQEGRLSRLRTDQSSIVEVELLPGVTGRYRQPRNLKRDEEANNSGATLDAVKKIVNQLQTVLRDSEARPAPQGLLFPKSEKEQPYKGAPRSTGRKKPFLR